MQEPDSLDARTGAHFVMADKAGKPVSDPGLILGARK